MEIMVLGTGLVGCAIVKDLAEEPGFHITAVDVNKQVLDKLASLPRVDVIQADLMEAGRTAGLVAGCDLVISAVPGWMGFDTLTQVIEAGKNIVDISFFSEDPFRLDDAARARNVIAVVDCGLAPGLCNIIAGHVDSLLDRTDHYTCYVGGLPLVREWPYEYKAVFSPLDVLEEYTRPVHVVEYGQAVVRPALSEVEQINFANVGTLEAFNTDGLRTLRKTLNARFMKEKTLRYPGHAALMRVFAESGFFGNRLVEIEGQSIRPMAMTSKLLSDKWKLKEGEADFTVMKIIMEGQKEEKAYRYTFNLLDRYDQKTRTTSMARVTGYTCTIVARQLASGCFSRKGICPPELIGRRCECYENLMVEYAKRNIRLEEMMEELQIRNRIGAEKS